MKYLKTISELNEARAAAAIKLFKMVVDGNASEIEGVKISSAMAQAALDWFTGSVYGRKYEKQLKTAGMGAVAPLIFGDNWGIKKRIPSKLKAEFKELQAQYKREIPESVVTEANDMSAKKLSKYTGFKEVEYEGAVYAFKSKELGKMQFQAEPSFTTIDGNFRDDELNIEVDRRMANVAHAKVLGQIRGYKNIIAFLKGGGAEKYESGNLKEIERYLKKFDFKSISESVVTEGKQPHKEIEKAIKGMKGVSMDIKGDSIIVSNKSGDEFIYSMNDADDVAEFITTIEESVVNESDKTATMLLADEIEGAEYHTAFGDGTTVTARSTKKTWDDGAPVLKYIARAPKKSVDMPKGKFEVVIDDKYGWIYWQDRGAWYGMDKDDDYIPFEF